MTMRDGSIVPDELAFMVLDGIPTVELAKELARRGYIAALVKPDATNRDIVLLSNSSDLTAKQN